MASATSAAVQAQNEAAPFPVAIGSLISGRAPEQAGRLYQQHDSHDYENDRIGRLRIEHLRQSFDETEPEAADDRAEDRLHAAYHDHREHDDDDIAAHQRADLVDRRRHDPGQRREPDPG